MKIVRIIILIFVFQAFLSVSAYAENKFYFFGKGNFVNSIGTESDYQAGENDFPIMSSHQNYGFGLGFTSGSGIVFYGVEVNFNLNGKTTLKDPSDDDTVEIDTYKYASGFLLLGFNIIRSSSIKIYINGGGGVSYALDAKTQTYTSQLGYETQIDPPEKKYPLSGFGGVGLEIYFSQTSGLFLGGRYQYIAFDEPQTMFIALAGIAFSF